VTHIGTPIIGRITGDPKGFQQRFSRQERCVCAPAKDRSQYPITPMIDGMPEPLLLFFLADKRPHFISLVASFVDRRNLLKSHEQMHTSAARTALECTRKYAAIRYMPSDMRPRHAAYFACGPTRDSHVWATLGPKGTGLIPLKTRNQLLG
jgi:hypothetical protein